MLAFVPYTRRITSRPGLAISTELGRPLLITRSLVVRGEKPGISSNFYNLSHLRRSVINC